MSQKKQNGIEKYTCNSRLYLQYSKHLFYKFHLLFYILFLLMFACETIEDEESTVCGVGFLDEIENKNKKFKTLLNML